jgi:transcriptional regulator with XRE-family HTH domain
VAATLSRDHRALGAAIRQLREKRGLSQERLAVLARLHRNYVGGIERGERNPTFTNLTKIAGALEVRLSAVVALSEKLAARS